MDIILFKVLFFITKSRSLISRNKNWLLVYTVDLRNLYFHLNENCVRIVFQNFITCYFPVCPPHIPLLNNDQCQRLPGLDIEI